MPCIFCQIVNHEKPSSIIYEDDLVIAIHDIRPIAPVHALILPKIHHESVNMVTEKHELALGHLFTAARLVAAQLGVDQSGYRLMVNTGPDAGQSVFHIHMHLIGGRHLPFRFD